MSHRCECHVTKPPATWPLAVVQDTGSPRLHHDWTVVQSVALFMSALPPKAAIRRHDAKNVIRRRQSAPV